jgi:hypothetical protein
MHGGYGHDTQHRMDVWQVLRSLGKARMFALLLVESSLFVKTKS